MSRFADAPTPPLDAPQLPEEPPKWPKVMGLLSVTVASVGLLLGLCGVGMITLLAVFRDKIEAQNGKMPDVFLPSAPQAVLGLLGFVWATLLLVAGIATLTRRRSGRSMHLVYAACSLVAGPIGLVLGVLQQKAIFDWNSANSGSEWAKHSNPTVAFAFMGIGVLIGIAWPLICLIWFAPARHSPEINAPDHI
jgi:hypothetical protein